MSSFQLYIRISNRAYQKKGQDAICLGGEAWTARITSSSVPSSVSEWLGWSAGQVTAVITTDFKFTARSQSKLMLGMLVTLNSCWVTFSLIFQIFLNWFHLKRTHGRSPRKIFYNLRKTLTIEPKTGKAGTLSYFCYNFT